jgi:hypothetical protein
MSSTVVNLSLSTIRDELHASIDSVQGIISGYLLSLALALSLNVPSPRRRNSSRVHPFDFSGFVLLSPVAGRGPIRARRQPGGRWRPLNLGSLHFRAPRAARPCDDCEQHRSTTGWANRHNNCCDCAIDFDKPRSSVSRASVHSGVCRVDCAPVDPALGGRTTPDPMT